MRNINSFIILVFLLCNIEGYPFRGNLENLNKTDGVGRLITESKIKEHEAFFEGDILMPINQLSRNGISIERYRWPNARIPYVIAGNFDAEQIKILENAFNEYHTKTCIKFVPRTDEIDYISIENSATGCWANGIGKFGGKQVVNLQSSFCLKKLGIPLHELMHVVGFLHEQNRPDRDQFVEIIWDNIQTGYWMNFYKARSEEFTTFNVSYDYESLMHYTSKDFSYDGSNTIVALNCADCTEKMGQRDGFSDKDILKIKRMYCPEL